MPTSDLLRAAAVCPVCRQSLAWTVEAALCSGCGTLFDVVDGIPVLLRTPPEGSQKGQQAAFFDEETDPEFETTRPYGAPRLYRWLMGYKLERSLTGIGQRLDGWTALVVCGGSGMDSSLLAARGASVVVSDISLGAARRVADRSRRFGHALIPVVADVEKLPFGDRSFDLVYVHDGLHHLEDPFAGLGEMARVARRAVSVTEPADAAITALAVRLGLAEEREESGNLVGRLRLDSVAASLEEHGFTVLSAGRYGMYYKHEPGAGVRILSAPGLFGASTIGLRAANAAAGRLGNKMTVQAAAR
jgi:SAM-dependent methyltransferase/uncharacterized protein YbaR (Trm112 family)